MNIIIILGIYLPEAVRDTVNNNKQHANEKPPVISGCCGICVCRAYMQEGRE